MMKAKPIGNIIALVGIQVFLLSVSLVWPQSSPTPSPSPVFDLSISPYEGGYELDFGRIDPSAGPVRREAVINVESNINTQYEVSNVLANPLCDGKGDCIPSNNIHVYGIRDSCRYGTVRQLREYYVDGVLYTSNTAGTSDSLTVVYSVIPFVGMKPGYYRGRIGFTLTSIGSTQRPVYRTLELIAQIEEEDVFNIEINGESGSEIRLVSNNPDMQTYSVRVDITGNYGEQFRITQEPTQAPLSSEGKWLEWRALKVRGSGTGKGKVVGPEDFVFPQQLLYESSLQGDADNFALEYSLGDLSGQVAGIYKTNIRYYLENINGAQRYLIATLGLSVEIANILDFAITPDDPAGIVFRDLRSGGAAEISKVTIDVASSSGKRYQVSQRLSSDLTNKEGQIIPGQYFLMRTQGLSTKGTLKFPAFDTVKKGDTMLFISDEAGSPDKFEIMYGLTIPYDVKAGEYTAQITYIVSEL